MFNHNFRRELAAAAARADLLATGPTIDPAAPLQFDQITAIADDGPLFEKFTIVFIGENPFLTRMAAPVCGSDCIDSMTTAAKHKQCPVTHASRCVRPAHNRDGNAHQGYRPASGAMIEAFRRWKTPTELLDSPARA